MRAPVLGGAAVAALLAAAPASAATVAVPACANGGAPVPVTGAGFTPGSVVTVKVGPATEATAVADAAGAFAVHAPTAEVVFAAPRTDVVTAYGPELDRSGTRVHQAQATLRVVKPDPGLDPGVRRPSLPARINGLGYPVGKVVYAHLRFRGRTVKTRRVGVATAPCGAVRGRVAGLFRVPGKGFPGNDRRYSVRIAAARRLTAATRPTGVIPVAFRRSLVDGRPQVVLGPSVAWLEGGS